MVYLILILQAILEILLVLGGLGYLFILYYIIEEQIKLRWSNYKYYKKVKK